MSQLAFVVFCHITVCLREESVFSAALIIADISKIPSHLLFVRLNKPTSLRFCLYVRCSEAILMAFAGFLPVHQHSFGARKPQTLDNIPDVAGIIAAPVYMATITLLWYSMLLVLFVTKPHCCLLFGFLSTGTFMSFSATLLPLSSLYGCIGLFCKSWKRLYLPSQRLMKPMTSICQGLSE